MRRFLREWVLNDWGLKLIALGLSFLLWAAYRSEPVVEIGYQVPLELTSIPTNLEVSGEVPTQVYVRLRGRSALLRRIAAGDIQVRADLIRARTGDNLIVLEGDAVKIPFGAQVVRLSPAQIHVVLTLRRTVPPSP